MAFSFRNLIFSAVAFVCPVSLVCAQTAAEQFTVRGAIDKGVDGDSVLLARFSAGRFVPVDTAVYKKGAFAFSGRAAGAHLAALILVKNGEAFAGSSFVIEPGELWVRLFKDPAREAEIPKSVTNALWRSFSSHDDEVATQLMAYSQALKGRLSAADQIACKSAIDSLNSVRAANVANFIKAHPSTNAADLVFSVFYRLLDDAQLKEVSAILSRNIPVLPGYATAMQELKAQRALMQQSQGGKFIDFTLPDENGKNVTASDVIKANKLTLIDFWASWCGPCREELRNTVTVAYKYFKPKGFEIIGVSLDSNKESWLGAIKSMGLNWIHVSDLKGWRCSAAQTYGVSSIPSSVLVDSEGNVVGRNLRGEQLIQTLLKHLK